MTRSVLRDRYNRFIERNEVAWEIGTAALAAAFVIVGFAADDAPTDLVEPLGVIDLTLTIVLALEFITRLVASRDRRAYLRGHWIDALAIIPTVRGLRVLRLLRLLRLLRVFAGVYRALSSLERFSRHRTLLGLFASWLAVAVICATAMYLAEVGTNPNIHDYTDALWWGVVTLTTVGYGDVFPVTPEGRLAGVALMLLGITLFAAITGTITSLLVAERETTAWDPVRRLRDLDDLHQDGILTDGEFAAAKTAVLAGWVPSS